MVNLPLRNHRPFGTEELTICFTRAIDATTDPQHIYQLESELNAFQIHTQKEVDNFAEAFSVQRTRARNRLMQN